MPKFAANLTMLYNEVDFLDRFDAAAKDGFKGVEYLFPYPYEKQQLVDRLKKNSLTQALHNLPAGDWAGGERGIAVLPDRVNEFQDGVGKAIDYATALGCKKVNVLAGITPKNVDAGKVRETFVSNLKFAAGKLKDAGITLVMEPINTFDIPGFYLHHTQQALDLIADVGSDNLLVQYDIYHMQRMEGELAATMQKNFAKIGHLQIADNPGRNEPGTGEINYPFLFGFIDKLGYDGWIGAEYKPAGKTSAGLGWLKPYLK